MTQRVKVRVEAAALDVRYDNFVALRNNNFSLVGNVIAVLGHNGAGKSTLIKALLGLLPIEKGSLVSSVLLGEDNTAGLRPERHMAFCPETGSVFADISVESYIKFWCRIKHRDPAYYKTKGAEFIELLTLQPLMKKLGRELSKGQRRRVQTAIGFLLNPRLFLFDEPFDGLDVQKTQELSEIISSQSSRTAFVISSHRMDVVERLADMILVLKEGEVASAGTPEKVCKDLADTTMVLSGVVNASDKVRLLRERLPSHLVNHIGAELRITGKKIETATLQSVMSEADVTEEVAVSTEVPSLVDAMNYHLREIRG